MKKVLKKNNSLILISIFAIMIILLFAFKYYSKLFFNNVSSVNSQYSGTWESESGIRIIIKKNKGILYPKKNNNRYYKGDIEILKGKDAVKELGANNNFITSFSRILKNNGYSKEISINDIYSVKFCPNKKESTISDYISCSVFALVPFDDTRLYMYEYSYNTNISRGFFECSLNENNHYNYVCGYMFEKR